MAVHLDHVTVPCRDKVASAKLLAQIFNVAWSEAGIGPFAPLYLNDGLTLDFDETAEPYPVLHYCFRVGADEFDAILSRLVSAGIKYRSAVRGPVDMKVDTSHGGKIAYWNQPDGHQWEILTVSYARQP